MIINKIIYTLEMFFIKKKLLKAINEINYKESENYVFGYIFINSIKPIDLINKITEGLTKGCKFYIYKTDSKIANTQLEFIADLLSVFGITLLIIQPLRYIKIFDNNYTFFDINSEIKTRITVFKNIKIFLAFKEEILFPTFLIGTKILSPDIIISKDFDNLKAQDLSNSMLCYVLNNSTLFVPAILSNQEHNKYIKINEYQHMNFSAINLLKNSYGKSNSLLVEDIQKIL